jgi:hypothetical protein
VQAKLRRGEYSNLSALESDCKRMVANAKQFNDKGSLVYEDAERVRKTASNFMTRWNPAYKNPNYVAVATPLPDEVNVEQYDTPYSTRSAAPGAESSRRSSQVANSRRKSSTFATRAREPEEEEEQDEEQEEEENEEDEQEDEDKDEDDQEDQLDVSRFKGKTFEKAQDMIMEELIDYTEYVSQDILASRR